MLLAFDRIVRVFALGVFFVRHLNAGVLDADYLPVEFFEESFDHAIDPSRWDVLCCDVDPMFEIRARVNPARRFRVRCHLLTLVGMWVNWL